MNTDSTKPTDTPIKPWEIPCPLTIVDIEFRSPPVQPKPPLLRQALRHFWPWLCFVICSVLSYFIVSNFIVTTVVVQGRSMTPTLAHGDRYLLHRWELLFRSPERGDLVVVRDATRNDFIVKRVVGLPGDRLQLKDGAVWVNGHRLNESYLPEGTRTAVVNGVDPLIVIGKNRYFVMGDNREISEDSRTYGPVLGNQILGFIPQ
jgi:signal peptidase I